MKRRFTILLFIGTATFIFGHGNSEKRETFFPQNTIFKNILVSLNPYTTVEEALNDEKNIHWDTEKNKAEAVTMAFAANELHNHFKLIGQELNLIDYDPKSIDRSIVIINSSLFLDRHPSLAQQTELEALGNQGFALIAEKKTLFIVANSRIGCLYGVYAFLRKMGFEWYNPYETIVPTTLNRKIQFYEMVKTPKVKLRGFWSFATEDMPEEYTLWLARNQFNIAGKTKTFLAKKLGIKIWAGEHNLIQEEFSKEELFEEHPEWYTLSKNKRFPVAVTGNYVNPSFANKEAAEYFSGQLIRRLQSGDLKHVDILNIWPSDKKNIRKDESKSSKSMGNFSDTLLYFYSIIAKNLEEAFENKILSRKVILAGISYHTTFGVPSNMSIVAELEKRDYIHIFYPSTRDWTSSIRYSKEDDATNMQLKNAIDSWKKSAKFKYGVVDYNLKSNYSGIAITNHINIASDFDYYFQEDGELYGYMHPILENPGPLELTNSLISNLCWQQKFESNHEVQTKTVNHYFKEKYGPWAKEWQVIYNRIMYSVSNAKHIFESGSLSSVLFQNIYWSKPPFSDEEIDNLIPRYLDGGLQQIPDGYFNSMNKMISANFIGLDSSIKIQAEMENKWKGIVKKVKDPKIINRMNNDIEWFKTTQSRYKLMKLCSELTKDEIDDGQRYRIKKNISKEVQVLSEAKTTADFISPVNSRGFLKIVNKYISQ
jgi:uncharacterized protein (DUF3820 family)